ncbi:MAG: PrsW family intramembrane metalloprotease [Phycisphaerales bacterium]|nr:PrsW family intramembrane metalloprotease [Phycisphaerales bacterium]
MLLSTIILYLTLAVCGVLIGAAAWRYDVYHREPLRMIVLTTAMGAALMWLSGRLQVWTINHFAEQGRIMPNISLASLAGLSEEIAKLLVVLVLARLAARHVNEPIDGMIYGSFAGLGAALEESVWVLGLDHATHLPPQEPVRLAGHLIFGGIGGYGVGLLVTGAPRAVLYTALALLGAATIHTLWDVVAFDAAEKFNASKALRWYHTAGGVALMLVGMVVYRALIADAARRTREWLGVCDLRTRQCPPER